MNLRNWAWLPEVVTMIRYKTTFFLPRGHFLPLHDIPRSLDQSDGTIWMTSSRSRPIRWQHFSCVFSHQIREYIRPIPPGWLGGSLVNHRRRVRAGLHIVGLSEPTSISHPSPLLNPTQTKFPRLTFRRVPYRACAPL